MKKKKIIVTTGGTGGHVIPAYELAKNLINKGYVVTFITDNRGMRFINSTSKQGDPEIKIIDSHPIIGNVFQKILKLIILAFSTMRAALAIFKIKPKLIISFGSYAAFPIMLAAHILKKCSFNHKILIHEQNSQMGKANLFFVNKCDIITSSFIKMHNCHSDEIKVVGHIVRPEIADYAKLDFPIFENGRINLFIMAGSQGSKSFSEIIPQAFLAFNETQKSLFHVVAQARKEDVKNVTNTLENNNVSCEVKDFFENSLEIMANSHLVISRSGAGSVAELSYIGRPAILIPYPLADSHQYYNAISHKGAVVIQEKDLTSDKIGKVLLDFLNDKNRLVMLAKTAKIPYDNALGKIIKIIEKIL